MKVQVEHEVPYDKGLESKCYYADGFDGNEVCKYHKFRNQTHGPRRHTEYHKPRCVLFEEWLPGSYDKCEACKQYIERSTQAASKKSIDEEGCNLLEV